MEVESIKALRACLDKGSLTYDQLRGRVVKVGFLNFTVLGCDQQQIGLNPRVWHLQGRDGQKYDFTPHLGLHRAGMTPKGRW